MVTSELRERLRSIAEGEYEAARDEVLDGAAEATAAAKKSRKVA